MTSKKISPITGLSDEEKVILRKLGLGNLSLGVRIAAKLVKEATAQGMLKGTYRSDYGYTLNGVQFWERVRRSNQTKEYIPLPTPNITHPYLGRYLTREQLRDTRHFKESAIRRIQSGQYVHDGKGYWWKRTDPKKCIINSRGQPMATYLGLAHEEDFTDYLMSDW